MIRKFISIENVGKSCARKPTGDVELRPLTLVYAENGRGKSTLRDITAAGGRRARRTARLGL